ncbi:MAG: RNA polymerase sigma factor [Sandaracinaceae bacterium]
MKERREVLFANFDHLDPTRLLWWADASGDERRTRLVREALDECLTKKQREVVAAYFFEGRSQSEIARALGVRQQVVHKRIFGVVQGGTRVGGALKRLAEYLAPRLAQ